MKIVLAISTRHPIISFKAGLKKSSALFSNGVRVIDSMVVAQGTQHKTEPKKNGKREKGKSL